MFLTPYNEHSHASRWYKKNRKRVVSAAIHEAEAIRLTAIAEAMGVSVAEVLRQILRNLTVDCQLAVRSAPGARDVVTSL